MARKKRISNNNGKQNSPSTESSEKKHSSPLLTDFAAELLVQIFNDLPYVAVNHLAASSKLFARLLNQFILKQENLLPLLWKDIKYYFGSTTVFQNHYDNQQLTALQQTDLQTLLKVASIIGKRMDHSYEFAFEFLQKFLEQNSKCLEAQFLLTQLIRLHNNHADPNFNVHILKGFQFAEFFYENNHDCLNASTLADYYLLLFVAYNKKPHLAFMLAHNNANTQKLKQAAAAFVNTQPIPPALYARPNQLPKPPEKTQHFIKFALDQQECRAAIQNQAEKESGCSLNMSTIPDVIQSRFLSYLQSGSQKDVLGKLGLNAFYMEKITNLVLEAVGLLSQSLADQLQQLSEVMKVQYIVALCQPGVTILIQNLAKYHIPDQLLNLTASQIQAFCTADFHWLFDLYRDKSVEEFKSLSRYFSNKGDLNSISKTLRKYAETQSQQEQLPSLRDLYHATVGFRIPGFDTDLALQQLKAKYGTKIDHQINALADNPDQKKIFDLLKDYFNARTALTFAEKSSYDPCYLKLSETQQLVESFKKYPFLQKICATPKVAHCIVDTQDAVIEKIIPFLQKFSQKELSAEAVAFVFHLFSHAEELNDVGLIAKVMNKVPSITIFKNIKSSIFLDLLANESEKPWFDLLTFEQMATIRPKTLQKIASYENQLQTTLINHLLLQYQGKTLQPSFKEIDNFVRIYKSSKAKEQDSKTESQVNNQPVSSITSSQDNKNKPPVSLFFQAPKKRKAESELLKDDNKLLKLANAALGEHEPEHTSDSESDKSPKREHTAAGNTGSR